MYIRSGEDNTTFEASRTVEQELLRVNDMPSKIDIITRGVRSTLESKKLTSSEDLYSARTNCIGSYLHLEKCLSRLAITVKPALVVRYPWEQADSCREIHILAAVDDIANNRTIITDPTPLSGYTYGKTSIAQAPNETGYFDSIDKQLDATTTCRVLSDDEFKAIVELYKYELGEHKPDSINYLSQKLDTIPSYKARLLRILIEQTNDELYVARLNKLPVESIRKSQVRYLTDKATIFRHERYQKQELKLRLLMGSKAINAAFISQTFGDYARWTAVARQVGAITNDKEEPEYPSSPLDISKSSPIPIFDYEKLMQQRGSTRINSNLYINDWDR